MQRQSQTPSQGREFPTRYSNGAFSNNWFPTFSSILVILGFSSSRLLWNMCLSASCKMNGSQGWTDCWSSGKVSKVWKVCKAECLTEAMECRRNGHNLGTSSGRGRDNLSGVKSMLENRYIIHVLQYKKIKCIFSGLKKKTGQLKYNDNRNLVAFLWNGLNTASIAKKLMINYNRIRLIPFLPVSDWGLWVC